MHTLIDAAVERWRTVFLLLAFIMVSGLVAYETVPKESAPDVKIPYIYTTMTLEGVSPEDAERLLLRPVEKKLQSIEAVKEMTAQATEGYGSVSLEFQAGFDSDKALADVRNYVDDAKPDLPEETDEPNVVELSFSKFPILNVSLTGDVDERTLVRLARDLRDAIENLSQVLEAKIAGDREEELTMMIDPLVLESYNISPAEVFERVDNNNILVPAGEMDSGAGSFALKLPGLIETARDMRQIPLKVDNGVVTSLEDVAEVRRGFKDRQNIARVNGKPAIGLQVSKRVGANIIETVEAVKAVVAEERAYWPPGVDVVYSGDQSEEIVEMLGNLQNNVILAILLVAGVVLVVMGIRSAALVAVAIPGAFLFGVLCLGLMGFTMNIVVLFSLILSIGMLVDAAIVVCEYADRLMMDGVPAHAAYPRAAKRMAWPIIASTVTTLVVFLPLLFWPGMVGEFMKFMPITLLLTLSGSLLMALIFTPALGAKLGKPAPAGERQIKAVRAADSGPLSDLHRFTKRYLHALSRALAHPFKTMGAIVGFVALIIAAFAQFGAGVEFFPDIEPKNVRVDVRAQGNYSVQEKDALVRRVEARIAGMEGIKIRFANAGKFGRQQDTAEDLIGQINLELVDWQKRRPADAILSDIRAGTADIPGVIIETVKQEQGPPVGKDVQIQFTSRAPETLSPAVQSVREGMKAVGGFINVVDERPVPGIEWKLTVNRELAGQFNVDVNMIGQVVKLATNGIIVNTYRPDEADDEIDIVVRFPEEYRNLSQLDRLRVHTPQGLVPINTFITREAQQQVGTIRRVDGQRSMTVRADVEPELNVDQKVTQLKAWMQQHAPLDPRVSVAFKGEDEEQAEAGEFLSMAFLVALFLMAIILVTQFNSIYAMFVIMSAVFFSTGGVFLALLITDTAFGIVMCGVGVISLAGIVVNNNIIFINTFKGLRQSGVELQEALLRTGAQRLRPILLTAGTTVLGLLPMVFEMTIDFFGRSILFGAPSSQWWVQLSTAIAGGLSFATILTLFFTPCLLLLEEKVPAWLRKEGRARGYRPS